MLNSIKMITISQAVEEIIRKKPFITEAINNGIRL